MKENTLNLTFGSFDGLHLGHRAVISRLVSLGCPNAVVCIDSPRAIYSPPEKDMLLKELGVERIYHISDDEISLLSAQELCRYMHRRFAPSCVVVGEKLRIGCDMGGADIISAVGKELGYSVQTVPTATFDGADVTWERLMAAIAQRDFPSVYAMMGRRYIITGKVIHGKGKGSKHSMPTANLEIADGRILPPHGVYGVMTVVEGVRRLGATNIGLRPAADDMPHPTVETHIPNFSGDLYDKEMLLELELYVRGVMDIPGGIDAVRRQVGKDMLVIEKHFEDKQKL